MQADKRGARQELVVAKWGDNPAVRLPAGYAKQLGVGEGDTPVAEIPAGGRLIPGKRSRAVASADLPRMRSFLDRQKVSQPVVAAMRRNARY